jgi:hypothetical protein
MLMGPNSDAIMFKSMMGQTIRTKEATQGQFMIYGLDEEHSPMLVSFSPYFEQGVLTGCRLDFTPSQVITLQAALEETVIPKAIVSSDSPHTVYLISAEFSALFGCRHALILGKPLHLIPNLGMDRDSEGWASLLHAACSGEVSSLRPDPTPASGSLSSPRGWTIKAVPVTNAPNGKVWQVLLLVDPHSPQPSTTSTNSTPQPLDGCERRHEADAQASGAAAPAARRGVARPPAAGQAAAAALAIAAAPAFKTAGRQSAADRQPAGAARPPRDAGAGRQRPLSRTALVAESRGPAPDWSTRPVLAADGPGIGAPPSPGTGSLVRGPDFHEDAEPQPGGPGPGAVVGDRAGGVWGWGGEAMPKGGSDRDAQVCVCVCVCVCV